MNSYYQPYWLDDNELEHYGVLGMKWGIRRYQNKDGTLTAAGKKRYAGDTPEQIERSERRKAKVIKGAKVGAAVAAVAAGGALTVSALLRGSPAGAVAIGSKTVDRLMRSGMLSREVGADSLSKSLKVEGTRSIDLANWNVAGNPYYKPGPSKSQQELMTLVAQYYLEQKR